MPEPIQGLEISDRRAQESLQEIVERGVQGLLDENREYQRRWNDPDALRARLKELERYEIAAAAFFALDWLLGGSHWLHAVAVLTAPVSPWW